MVSDDCLNLIAFLSQHAMPQNYFESALGQKSPERPKKPEDYFDQLESMLQKMASEINAEFGPLVKDDCSIDERGFSPEIYPREEAERDARLEAGGALEINDKSRPFWKEKIAKRLRVTPEQVTDKMIQAEFRRDRKKKHGFIAEMAVTGILHKALRDRFLVTRASNFDDLRHGIDNVIVDRQTGTVVCAFDDVTDEKQGEREKEKQTRIKQKARQGGSRIKYGLTFEKSPETGECLLAKKGVQNVPTFYLSLTKDELSQALAGMDFDPDSPQTETESRMFSKMFALIQDQMKIIRAENPKSPALETMDFFGKTLQEMNASRPETHLAA